MVLQRVTRARVEIVVTLAVALAAGAAIALPGLMSDRSSDRLRTEAAPSTTATAAPTVSTTASPATSGAPTEPSQPPATTAPETTLPPPPPITSTPAPAPTDKPRSSPTTHHDTPTTVPETTTAPCHNSTESRCGDFQWDPPPGDNAPMSVSIEPSSSDVHVGDTVTFHVSADDPDGRIDSPTGCGYAVGFGDGSGGGGCAHTPSCSARYGPWSPPPPAGGSTSGSFSHVYDAPGRYTFDIRLNLNGSCYDPYRSQGSATVSVEVNR